MEEPESIVLKGGGIIGGWGCIGTERAGGVTGGKGRIGTERGGGVIGGGGCIGTERGGGGGNVGGVDWVGTKPGGAVSRTFISTPWMTSGPAPASGGAWGVG